jgi:hypothetical protein
MSKNILKCTYHLQLPVTSNIQYRNILYYVLVNLKQNMSTQKAHRVISLAEGKFIVDQDVTDSYSQRISFLIKIS